ncbi:DedA family protein [Streptomyces sp. NPDC050287]|uniref:DedA family protein n=1 Tax=Streptomyces sp. NPDC050287 TaxID=3365608 RepID=UPI0037A76D31
MWRFLSLTTLGSLIWNAGFVVAGYQLGANWQTVDEYADIFQKAVIAVVALSVVVFVAVRMRERGQSQGNAP